MISSPIRGGSQNDVIRGDAGNDSLLGDNGRDRLIGQNGNDTLKGGSGRDILIGGAGDDELVIGGLNGPDQAFGGDSKDRIEITPIGSSAKNAGFNEVFGGADEDFYLFKKTRSILSTPVYSEQMTVIKDFDPTEDKIRLPLGSVADYDQLVIGNTNLN